MWMMPSCTAVGLDVERSVVVVMPSSSSMRRHSEMANRGLGRAGEERRRSSCSGSVGMVASFLVGVTEGGAGPGQQRLGGLLGAVEQAGDLPHGQVVDVAQGQGRTVVRAEL